MSKSCLKSSSQIKFNMDDFSQDLIEEDFNLDEEINAENEDNKNKEKEKNRSK